MVLHPRDRRTCIGVVSSEEAQDPNVAVMTTRLRRAVNQRSAVDVLPAGPERLALRRQARSDSHRERRHAIQVLNEIVALLEAYDLRLVGRIWIKKPARSLKPREAHTFSVQDIGRHLDRFLKERGSEGLILCDGRTRGGVTVSDPSGGSPRGCCSARSGGTRPAWTSGPRGWGETPRSLLPPGSRATPTPTPAAAGSSPPTGASSTAASTVTPPPAAAAAAPPTATPSPTPTAPPPPTPTATPAPLITAEDLGIREVDTAEALAAAGLTHVRHAAGEEVRSQVRLLPLDVAGAKSRAGCARAAWAHAPVSTSRPATTICTSRTTSTTQPQVVPTGAPTRSRGSPSTRADSANSRGGARAPASGCSSGDVRATSCWTAR